MKCIVKIANQAGISERTRRLAMKTMNELVEMEISAGKLPMGLAATVLYMSCLKNGEDKTQRDIADAAGVTEVTIRNRFNDLKTKLHLN
jgi:transcription initiation factor TFIIB